MPMMLVTVVTPVRAIQRVMAEDSLQLLAIVRRHRTFGVELLTVGRAHLAGLTTGTGGVSVAHRVRLQAHQALQVYGTLCVELCLAFEIMDNCVWVAHGVGGGGLPFEQEGVGAFLHAVRRNQ